MSEILATFYVRMCVLRGGGGDCYFGTWNWNYVNCNIQNMHTHFEPQPIINWLTSTQKLSVIILLNSDIHASILIYDSTSHRQSYLINSLASHSTACSLVDYRDRLYAVRSARTKVRFSTSTSAGHSHDFTETYERVVNSLSCLISI